MKKIGVLVFVVLVVGIIGVKLSACESENEKLPQDDRGGGFSQGTEGETSDKGLVENRDYIRVDQSSIDFQLKDLKGNEINLSDHRGKLVFLNFWATWCPPCLMEMPFMESIHKTYGDDVIILAVSSTELQLKGGKDGQKAKRQVENFIDKEGYTFPIPLDPENEVFNDYNNVFPMLGIPTTYMIDREGIVRYVKPTAFRGEEEMKEFIDLLEK